MTNKELNALEEVVKYVMQNERISYEEHLDGGDGEEHIYTYAKTLNDYLNKGE